jgi:hypothetical protein
MNATQAKKYKQKMDALQKKLDKKSSTASQKPPPKAPKEKKTTVANPYTSKKKKATVPADPCQESCIFVQLCNTIPFPKEDETAKYKMAKTTLRFLKNYIHERVPTCHLLPAPALRWKPHITIKSEEE